MATIRFKVTVRQLSNGCDYHVTLFAKDAETAQDRAIDRARFSAGISPAEFRRLRQDLMLAVFRIISCEVDPDQTRPISSQYSPVAVNKAIEASNRAGRKISGTEARKIHALLAGRH